MAFILSILRTRLKKTALTRRTILALTNYFQNDQLFLVWLSLCQSLWWLLQLISSSVEQTWMLSQIESQGILNCQPSPMLVPVPLRLVFFLRALLIHSHECSDQDRGHGECRVPPTLFLAVYLNLQCIFPAWSLSDRFQTAWAFSCPSSFEVQVRRRCCPRL